MSILVVAITKKQTNKKKRFLASAAKSLAEREDVFIN